LGFIQDFKLVNTGFYDGTMTIAKASINKFEILDKAQIIDGVDAWGPIAIADGYLVMRDSKRMVCVDVRK